MQSCTNPVKESAVFIQSILMAQVPLMCSVTKRQPVGGGQCSRRDKTVLLISSLAAGTDYKIGFGNLNGEFWLGLDKINRLTNSAKFRLRVDLEDTKGKTAYASYDYFAVTSEKTKYKLSLGTYSGKLIYSTYESTRLQ